MLNRAASGAKYAYFFIDSNLCRQPHATHLTSRKHGVATPIFNRHSYSRHGGSERRSRCFRFFHGKNSHYISFKQLFRAKKSPPPIFLQIVVVQLFYFYGCFGFFGFDWMRRKMFKSTFLYQIRTDCVFCTLSCVFLRNFYLKFFLYLCGGRVWCVELHTIYS